MGAKNSKSSAIYQYVYVDWSSLDILYSRTINVRMEVRATAVQIQIYDLRMPVMPNYLLIRLKLLIAIQKYALL